MAKRAAALAKAVRTAKIDFAAASDRELLQQFAEADDQAAFAAVAERHAAMVLGVCKRVLHSQADAEDACQAVFLILSRKAGKNRWQASVANWLYATARKVSQNARVAATRRAKREGAAAVAEAVPPTDTLSGPEMLAALDEELERLTPRYREPLVLCYLEGLTRDEAATRLSVPVATLKSQLERGRKKLADALTARGCALGVALLLTATSSVGASPPRLVDSIRAAVDGAPSSAAAALAKGVAMNGLIARTKWAVLVAFATAVTGFGFAYSTDAQPQQKTADKMEKAATKADAPKGIEGGERTIAGTVFGVDGKPAAGVKLFHPTFKVPFPRQLSDIVVKEVGQTDAAGKFRVTLTGKHIRDFLIAHAPGFGIDWVESATGEVTMKLTPDVPIRGRILTTEGKPAAGVSVSIVAVYAPQNDKLDSYLTEWKTDIRNAMSSPRKRVMTPFTPENGSTKTDADGRFTLSGAGSDRIVQLLVEGGDIARQNPTVITRSGFDPKPYNEMLLDKRYDALRILNHYRGLNGPDFTLLAERGKSIDGTITDMAGKPVTGAMVSIQTGYGDGMVAQTDTDGKYRLAGVPKRTDGYLVSVNPPEGKGFLSASGNATDTDGFTPVRHDIKLAKGVVVVGRVIDKQTGKGVEAGVRFAPLPGNKFFASGPGSDSYRTDRTMTTTDKEGRFRVSTIPGQALLMAQVHAGEKFNGEHLNPFRRATPDPAHKDLFKYDADDDTWTVNSAGNSLEFLNTEHAVKVVDLKESGETTVELIVDRGVVGRLEIQDADGKPLSGAYVAGLTDSWPLTYKLPEAIASVYALNPAKPRTIGVYHPAKNLGAIATIRGDEKEPVVVKLAPAATITGRFAEDDGVPLAGAEISVNARKRVVSELYRFTVKERPRVVTDAKGQFTLSAIVPGMDFSLQLRKGEQSYGGKPKIGILNLKAGETKALGDRVVEQLR